MRRLFGVQSSFWNEKTGIFNAATQIGKQPDIWASVLAVAINFPISENKKETIIKYLLDNYAKLIYQGQLRHLPQGCYWDKLFIAYPKDTYQNGGYWGTPLSWLMKTLILADKNLARRTLEEAANLYDEIGFCEWINKAGEFALPEYGATAANFLDAVKAVES